jgi:hypothetical protein
VTVRDLSGATVASLSQTFDLAPGERKLVSGIPVGWMVEATETLPASEAALWEGSWTGGVRTGTVGVTDILEFTRVNRRRTGSVRVTKTATGPGASDMTAFPMTVTVRNGAGEVWSVENFDLASGGSRTLSDIPMGYTATVTEGDTRGLYDTTWSPTNGTVTVGDGTTVVVTCTNARRTGSVSIAKRVTGNGSEPGRAFSFDVTVADLSGQPFSGTLGGRRFVNGVCRVSVSQSGSPLVITGIPSGYGYTVSEVPDADYEPVGATQATGVIAAGGVGATSFTNHRIVGYVTLEKLLDV